MREVPRTEQSHLSRPVTGESGHLHEDDGDAASDEEIARAIWRQDNVELLTVGIDIGSATSHLMFSRLHMQRQTQRFSSRFIVVERRALYRSPIRLTPYRGDGLIDVVRLRSYIHDSYAEAGIGRGDVDAGAVILTGVALERSNARAIAELFAGEGGKFVCASAGHNLEALLAAHGSGAVAASKSRGPVLNVDIGGGTTKLALSEGGRVIGTLAISAGARLVELSEDGTVVRIEHAAADIARDLGVPLRLGDRLSREARRAIAARLAERIVASTHGNAPAGIRLAGELPASPLPVAVVLSGGVGELVGAASDGSFGDLGHELAGALRARLAQLPAPVIESAERIRATVIGASQFSVQLSGNTVQVSDEAMLPLHNVPVISVDVADDPLDAAALRGKIERGAARLDLSDSPGPVAIAMDWDGEPYHATLRELAAGIASAHAASARAASPVIVALTGDIGASLGRILTDELGIDSGVIAIDGLELADLDYIDIGDRIRPANVVPVVVKSLVFPETSGDLRPQILKEVRS